MTDTAAGERLVLPDRPAGLRPVMWMVVPCVALVMLAPLGLWAAGFDPVYVLGLVFALVAGIALVRRFADTEATERLVLSPSQICATDRSVTTASTEWVHVDRVVFDSGHRYPNVHGGVGRLPLVLWYDDAPHDRWNPDRSAGSVTLQVMGRRNIERTERALREVCAEHGVELDAYWSWAWRVSGRRHWRHPEPKPPRRPW